MLAEHLQRAGREAPPGFAIACGREVGEHGLEARLGPLHRQAPEIDGDG